MRMDIRLNFPATHPALAGHFPGNPIVPGVLLLDAVATALARQMPGAQVSGLPNVKFLSPLRPGEDCLLHLEAAGGGRWRFTMSVGERRIASGSLLLAGAVA